MGTVDIYGITGFFEDRGPTFPFGGFFHAEEGGIHGKLADNQGMADIHGEIRESHLQFCKSYENRQFTYSFVKQPNGLWVGEYQGLTSPRLRGNAWCKITPHWERIDFMAAVNNRRAVIEGMLQRELDAPITDKSRR